MKFTNFKNLIFCVFLLLPFKGMSAENINIYRESTYNPTHVNKYSFMVGVNPSLNNSGEMSNFTFSYARKLENFWFDSNLLITKGIFDKLSANNPSATGAANNQLTDQKNTVTSIGLGIGRETRYAQTLLPFENIYEFMAANITYTMYKEDFSGKSFNARELLTKYNVYKKFNDYFSAGAHFNYNLAVVKRSSENDTETSSSRSLTLGFLTVGLDVSFYL